VLDDFLTNDVSVRDATSHLWADLDRQALLVARLRPGSETLRAARATLGSVPSALAWEAFVARPLTKKGQHAEALAVRRDALRFTPRWDPFQSRVLLCGLAESLLALGQPEEARVAAHAAHRHAPLDPYALRAWADAARACAATADAAAVDAWLRDHGYGKPIVSGPPTDEQRAAEAAALPLTDVAPLDDEAMARHLVMMEVDEGFQSKRYRFPHHVMALIRRGELGLARNMAAGDDGESNLATVLSGWMNLLPPEEIAWLQKDSLRRALDQTEEGAAARTGSRAKKPNRYWSWDALNHLGYRTQLVKAGDARACEALLFCVGRQAFLEGVAQLPDHPIVQRFKVLRAELSSHFPPADALQSNRGARATLGVDGQPVAFYEDEKSDRAEMPPCFEVVESGVVRCSLCKQSITAGTLALRVGRISPSDGEAKLKRYHSGCASGNAATHKQLALAVARERRIIPGL
jgi:hypothetical protein